LADALGLTVQTITRGYNEAKRRGLISGEIGRGTFVRSAASPLSVWSHPHQREPSGNLGMIDLSANIPYVDRSAADLAPALLGLAQDGALTCALQYQPRNGHPRHRRAGATFLSAPGMKVDPERVVVTAGAQHAILLALSVCTQPGDVVLTEALTYPGIKAIARFLNLQLAGIEIDRDGLCPEALEAACRRFRPKALYCVPTLQNPTATVMPQSRRHQLAAIAAEHQVALVEDDIYRFLLDGAPTPIASLLPDQSYYLASLSKDVAPGLRIGFLYAPSSQMEPLTGAMTATMLMASPLCAEIATRLIEDGTASRLAQERRDEIRRRQVLARQLLGPHLVEGSDPASTHLWLRLPAPWRAQEFVQRAQAEQVLVSAAEIFAVGRSAAPHAIRLSVAAVADAETLRQGLATIAKLIRAPPAPYLSGI
jgi:DNA-binding transcriptional MocR family regulator